MPQTGTTGRWALAASLAAHAAALGVVVTAATGWDRLTPAPASAPMRMVRVRLVRPAPRPTEPAAEPDSARATPPHSALNVPRAPAPDRNVPAERPRLADRADPLPVTAVRPVRADASLSPPAPAARSREPLRPVTTAFVPEPDRPREPSRPSPARPSPQAVAVAAPVPGVAEAVPSPRVVHLPGPEYPAAARRRGEVGRVVLDVEVLPDGRVGAIRLVSTEGGASRRLVAAAEKAARHARFTPYVPAPGAARPWVRIPFRFELR